MIFFNWSDVFIIDIYLLQGIAKFFHMIFNIKVLIFIVKLSMIKNS